LEFVVSINIIVYNLKIKIYYHLEGL